MAAEGTAKADARTLLDEYRLYYENVELVSYFEWLYTETRDMPGTVKHFERFPTIPHPDGNKATPDFTVVFNDGTGLAGEIASLATNDKSVESLCSQIGRYDSLTTLPVGSAQAPVKHVDVLLLVPPPVSTGAVRRVIRERYENPDHPYKPSNRPCIVQYIRGETKLTLQRLGHQENGRLREGKKRGKHAIGKWFDIDDVSARWDQFSHVVAQRPFVNDPAKPLHLAVELWTKVFATMAAEGQRKGNLVPLEVDAVGVAGELRSKYGVGRADEVETAMNLLVSAGVAEVLGRRRWRVVWGEFQFRPDEDDDLKTAFALRSTYTKKPSSTVARYREMVKKEGRQAQERVNRQPTLFDLLNEGG